MLGSNKGRWKSRGNWRIHEISYKRFFNQCLLQRSLGKHKKRIDLAIYTGNDVDSDVAVIIETKRPSNKPEFLSEDNINKKALQEIFYFITATLEF